MPDGVPFILLILAGLAAVAWGLPAAHRLRPPLDGCAALLVLAGVLLAVTGVLLTVIPRFFG